MWTRNIGHCFCTKTIKQSPDDLFKFQSLSGELTVSCQSTLFTLNFPAIPATLNNGIKSAIEEKLALQIDEVWQARDRYVCFFI
ncbi:hypothetical protein PROPEN_01687 [Proteus penneri ATCC 35198]|nr:hypothetical protein PROPEN_01687 [Proteus penneri ATCC 35198]